MLTKVGTCFVMSLTLWGLCPLVASAKPPSHPSQDATDSLESKKYKKPQKTSATKLSKIIKEALAYHPSIEADKVALSAADDVIDQATAAYMPSVDLRLSVGRESIRRNFNVNSLNPLPSTGAIATTRTDPSITIRQILFDGMGTASRVARARSQRNQAHGALGVTTDTATIDAATAIIDVRRLQRLLQIVNNNIRFHQLIKAKVTEIVRAKVAPISDLFQLEARLQDTFVSKANIQSDLEVTRAKFIEVVGKEPPDHIRRIHLPAYLTPTSVERAVRMALDNNNSIKVAKSNVQIAETNHRESSSKLVPTVTFELEGEKDRNTSATTGFQDRITAMVVARHNLFSGGADMAKSRETIKRLTESHARLNLAHRQIERTIRAAWGEARNAREKSVHLANLIREKRLIRDAYLKEFFVGKRTLIDVLDAANDVFITEATRTSIDATADINTITLSVGTGQFRQFMNKEGHELNIDEFDDQNDTTLTSDIPQLTSHYTQPKMTSLQPIRITQPIPFKVKSIFERRKEERQNAFLNREPA